MRLTQELIDYFGNYRTTLKVGKIFFVLPANLSHKCKRCGVCCTKGDCNIHPEEIERIKKLGYDGFYKKNDKRETGYMMATVNGKCMFLDYDKDKKASCRIYKDRPIMCKIYPYMFELCDFGKNNRKLGAFQWIEDLVNDQSICCGWEKKFNTKRALLPAAKYLEYALDNKHLLGKGYLDRFKGFL